jgi:hypothetical protein
MDLPPVPYILSLVAPFNLYATRTYVSALEVTTLKHKLGDDAVEFAAGISEALLASAESTEVLGGFGNYVIVEDEVNATRLL